MAPEKQVFDPDGNLTLVLPRSSVSMDTSPKTPQKSCLKHKSPPKEEHVHMQVSSKHMMLASPVFKAMLTGSFQEGETLRATGKVEVPLPDDNPIVFTILLDIIHGRGRRVPRKVPLKLLALLSIAVDKYQLQESAGAFSDSWIDGADPPHLGRMPNCFMWLSISWVFHDSERFSLAADFLIRCCTGHAPDKYLASENLGQSLPIPDTVLDAIQKRRQDTMSAIYAEIAMRINLYMATGIDPRCKNQDGKRAKQDCDAMVLGSLIRHFSGRNMWPAPNPPYMRSSVQDLVYDVKMLRIRSLCSYFNGDSDCEEGKVEGSRHSIERRIIETVKKIDDKAGQLSIEDFEHN
ncbi:uncharacterized protein PAC_10449 [Phialocephala subalpina]|uniref:Uncharacterized protein n=1 Tax=Phialocephala subalpina TaxID=576137 RepID=A0A1L7X6C0_9HELO|nr:uncharacterized protein PAC_10449 [Phialocephala subalpina]